MISHDSSSSVSSAPLNENESINVVLHNIPNNSTLLIRRALPGDAFTPSHKSIDIDFKYTLCSSITFIHLFLAASSVKLTSFLRSLKVPLHIRSNVVVIAVAESNKVKIFFNLQDFKNLNSKHELYRLSLFLRMWPESTLIRRREGEAEIKVLSLA